MIDRHVSTRVPSDPREAAAKNRNSENDDRETHDRAGVDVQVSILLLGGWVIGVACGDHGRYMGIRMARADRCASKRYEVVHSHEAEHHKTGCRNTHP